MSKFIVVAGGVISGVGKGVTTAALARVLAEYGFKVTTVKIDPYINYDAGTLRPTEHGEVWVTDDGGEIDQDLGTYERFLNKDIPKKNNLTTGQVYKTIIDRERKGRYLGKTVQFIPHVPKEINRRIKKAAEGHDITVVEIGGTIGDYENIPFLFAVKALERELGKENVVHILVTYLPVPSHIEEMKTKPTQQAIRLLGEQGILPDFIICRSKDKLDKERKQKIETYANIPSEHVISEPDIDTVYQIPLDLEREKLAPKILQELKLKPKKEPNWNEWKRLVQKILSPSREIDVAIVGKYVDIGDYSLSDSYLSVNQSLIHAGAALNVKINIHWIDSKQFEGDKPTSDLKKFQGIVVPGGFGNSGVEGKIKAIKYARQNNIPYLGLCLGRELAGGEYNRNVCGIKEAHTTEVDPDAEFPIIDILPTQKKLMEKSDYGGTMRLGAYAAVLAEKSQVLKLYKETGRLEEDAAHLKDIKADKDQGFRLGILDSAKNIVLERHRHRYEVNPKLADQVQGKDLVFSGHHIRYDSTKLMEFIEMKNHPFFIATQAHPEFKSRFGNPSPLFYGFVKACMKN